MKTLKQLIPFSKAKMEYKRERDVEVKRHLDNKEKINLSSKIKLIDNLVKGGFIGIDYKEHQVCISTDTAYLFQKEQSTWEAFLQNVQFWFAYTASTELWNRYFTDVEVKAVRAAKAKYAHLSATEERKVRFEARQAVNVDAVKLPPLPAFDFIVVSHPSTGGDAKVIVVGNYSDDRFVMVPYNEVTL